MKNDSYVFLLFVFLLFVNPLPASGTEVVPLPDLLKPSQFMRDADQIYIAEKAAVYIYSAKGFKLIKKFGREGEGPEEFKEFIEWLDCRTDRLVINSFGRISYFKKNGEFISQKNITVNSGRLFEAIGDRFIGRGFTMVNNMGYRTINIYDSKLEKIKELYRREHEFQQGRGIKAFTASFEYWICDNKIFITKEKDFEIDVFDNTGKKLFTIKQDYEKIEVTGDDKKGIFNYFRTNPDTKNQSEWIIGQLKFPVYFPAIRDFYAINNKLYVRTFKQVAGKTEYFVFDCSGKLLKRVFIPVKEKNKVETFPYTFWQGKYYQLIDNEESEEWELHITGIE